MNTTMITSLTKNWKKIIELTKILLSRCMSVDTLQKKTSGTPIFREVQRISLDKQIFIYSVDTGAFFTDKEKEIEDARFEALRKKKNLKFEEEIIRLVLNGKKTEKTANNALQKKYKVKEFNGIYTKDRIEKWHCSYKSKKRFIAEVEKTTYFEVGQKIEFTRSDVNS